MIQLYIKDNGMRFDKRRAKRNFAVFYRVVTEDAYEGNGVGLAIAKKRVEKHAEHMWVESQVGLGTVFYCAFKNPSR